METIKVLMADKVLFDVGLKNKKKVNDRTNEVMKCLMVTSKHDEQRFHLILTEQLQKHLEVVPNKSYLWQVRGLPDCYCCKLNIL